MLQKKLGSLEQKKIAIAIGNQIYTTGCGAILFPCTQEIE